MKGGKEEERMENGTGNCYLPNETFDGRAYSREETAHRSTWKRRTRTRWHGMGLNSGSKTSPPAIFFPFFFFASLLPQLDRSDLINILIPRGEIVS